ncbi:hypothetical protein [Methyloradius palustris]|uniref:Uncharacterized protein n=1 Tax=Methyloradius palustris TaxID=2778876 RepID=A0A8D5K0H8_9PROT|nr:hypothetical protein [Methyloradius palustris]BCM24763.1 hypothetical protein ZMTM_10220 [Methyloradius palustris]
MSPEQFRSLAESYGADLKRWPDNYQAAAKALIAEGSAEVETALKQANMLDEILNSHVVSADRRLADLIINHALPHQPASESHKQSSPRWWNNTLWPSIGFASASLAGAIAGIFCVSLLTSTMSTPDIGDGSNGTADVIDFGTDWR